MPSVPPSEAGRSNLLRRQRFADGAGAADGGRAWRARRGRRDRRRRRLASFSSKKSAGHRWDAYDESGRAGFCSRGELDEALAVRRNVGEYSARVLHEIEDPQLHECLVHFFRPHNRALDLLLGWETGYPT